MEKLRCCSGFLENSKPYFAMISLQFGYAGMNIITKVSLNRGMSHYVLVVYRHAFATAVIAPFAIFLERFDQTTFSLYTFSLLNVTLAKIWSISGCFFNFRKAQPKITFPVFMQIFVLALLGYVLVAGFELIKSYIIWYKFDSNYLNYRPVIDQNFYYAGLKFTSPTFSCAMSNMLPAMTFVMAVIFR